MKINVKAHEIGYNDTIVSTKEFPVDVTASFDRYKYQKFLDELITQVAPKIGCDRLSPTCWIPLLTSSELNVEVLFKDAGGVQTTMVRMTHDGMSSPRANVPSEVRYRIEASWSKS